MKVDLAREAAWDEFAYQFYVRLREMLLDPPRPFVVVRSHLYRDDGPFALHFSEYECIFAARMLAQARPETILDVGSYRHFVFGLLSNYRVTSVDIRPRNPSIALPNETLVVCDAKKLDLPSNSYDAVVSLCSVEHFGLGRYGDEFDLDADTKGFAEMRRVVKPGGAVVWSVPVTQAQPCIVFNAHRIYTYEMIEHFCDGLTPIAEEFFNPNTKMPCQKAKIADVVGDWSVYCGAWRKNADEGGDT